MFRMKFRLGIAIHLGICCVTERPIYIKRGQKLRMPSFSIPCLGYFSLNFCLGIGLLQQILYY